MESNNNNWPEPQREMLSERLTFEPISPGHATKLYEALGDPRVHEFIDSEDFQSQEAIIKFIDRVTAGLKKLPTDKWVNIVCLLENELTGLLQATLHGDWAEIAYLFDPRFQGKGYATEGVQWLLTYLREAEGVKEFWATTTPMNIRSISLLNRTGFSEVQTWQRVIASYDPGDSVFQRIDA